MPNTGRVAPEPAARARTAEARAVDLERVHRAIEVLSRLAELFRVRRQQLAEEAGLTDPQWEVLEEISTEHFMPTMFARRRDSSPAAVSKLIRQLVDKGFVTVSVARGDARHREYGLTPRGKRALDTLRQSRAHAIEQVWLTFGAAELDGFSRFGSELANRLAELTETSAHARSSDSTTSRPAKSRRNNDKSPQ